MDLNKGNVKQNECGILTPKDEFELMLFFVILARSRCCVVVHGCRSREGPV